MAHGTRRDGTLRAAVLDTNVYVSALLAGGVPAQVISLGRKGVVNVVMSEALLHELLHVLQDKFHWSAQRLQSVRIDVDEFIVVVEPAERIRAFTGRQEADNRVLEAAVAGHADAIITGDRDLLALRQFREIPILTPRQFLDLFRKETA